MDIFKNDLLKSIALAFIGFSIWAIGDATVRGLGHYPSMLIYWFATGIACALLCILASKMGGWRDTLWGKPKLKMRMLRGFIIMIANFLSVITFSHLELTKAYAIVFMIPLMAKILSVVILKESIRLRSWIISIIGFCGVLIVLRPGAVPLEIGSVAAMCLTVFWALGYVMTKWIGEENQTHLSMTIYAYFFGFIVSSFFVFAGDELSVVRPEDLPFLLSLGLLSVSGTLFVSKAYAKGPTAYVAPVHYTQILWGAGLGALFFGEYPDLFTIIGGSIIIAAGMALIYFSRKPVRTVPASE